MAVELRSPFLTYYLRLPEGEWDVLSLPHGESCIEQARMTCRGRLDGADFLWAGDMPGASVSGPELRAGLHGEVQACEVRWRDQATGLRFLLEVQLTLTTPLLLWRLAVENSTRASLELQSLEMMAVGPGRSNPPPPKRRWLSNAPRTIVPPGGIRIAPTPGSLRFFSHGWQSWSFTGTVGERQAFPHSRLGPIMTPKHWNAGTPRPPRAGYAVSDMFGVLADTTCRKGVVVGSLSQSQAFTSLEAHLDHFAPTLAVWQALDDVQIAPGGAFTTDWTALSFIPLDETEAMSPFLAAAARECQARPALEAPVGWCSWYQFFDALRYEDLSENLDWIRTQRDLVSLDWVQLDDGFEPLVGDWQRRKEGYPEDLRRFADAVRAAGSRPGIWLAPFVAHPKSELAARHPEWLLRNQSGRPVHVGFSWNTFARALDLSRPEVVAFAGELIDRARREWGFDYLKLDFLYAGALWGKRADRSRTRAQVLRDGLMALRQAAGDDALLVGCGCPIGSGVGIFDVMRVGPDVGPSWHPEFHRIGFPFRREPEMPSARNALRNAVTRAMLHNQWWVNDPDCVLLRPLARSRREAAFTASGATGEAPQRKGRGVASQLSDEEARTLATVVSMAGGSILDSDDLPALPAHRLAWLQRILPPLPGRTHVLDLWDASYPELLLRRLAGAVGTWWLLAVVNWEDRPRLREIELARYAIEGPEGLHCMDFWGASYLRLERGQPLRVSLPAHGSAVFALRAFSRDPQWVGDTLHISQGLCVQEWRTSKDGVRASLRRPHSSTGRIWMGLDFVPHSASFDGSEVSWQPVQSGVVVFHLPRVREGILLISNGPG
jgi:alpha-galactosidase